MELDTARWRAEELMTEHGLIDEGWRLVFDNARTRTGRCSFRKQEISLSRHLVRLNDWRVVRDTVLHEIAHALVGARHGHDRVWKAKATAIGARARARPSPQEKVMPVGRWRATCGCGGRVYRRHRRPRQGYRYKCSGCRQWIVFVDAGV